MAGVFYDFFFYSCNNNMNKKWMSRKLENIKDTEKDEEINCIWFMHRSDTKQMY